MNKHTTTTRTAVNMGPSTARTSPTPAASRWRCIAAGRTLEAATPSQPANGHELERHDVTTEPAAARRSTPWCTATARRVNRY